MLSFCNTKLDFLLKIWFNVRVMAQGDEQSEGSPNTPVSNPDSRQPIRQGFGGLGESIISSLSIGVVAFDRQLRIIQANGEAGRLVGSGDYVDEMLARGTDARIWGNWKEFLQSVFESDTKGDFGAVKYHYQGTEKVLHIVCTPLKDVGGHRVIGGAVIIEDVTDRVNAEYQLAQTERLAAVGKVAGKVAHELNNPMDGILRYINLALRIIDKGDYDKAKEYLRQSRSGLMRMLQIIGELLEFSRSTHSAFEYATVDKIAADAVRAMASGSDGVDIQIVHDCEQVIPPVKVMSLFQIFCNLIKNALDAMDGRGKLVITISCPDNTVVAEFRDTGCGFDPEEAEKIFEPFYTTKAYGKGTGLGLSICKDIVEKYGGRITAENAPEGGGIFTVQLPLTRAVVQQPR